jgi:hypothetical protein
MKFTLAATIPTGQYANVQPSIEVEAATLKRHTPKRYHNYRKSGMTYVNLAKN